MMFQHHPPRTAFTLIEVLAVAMIAAVAGMSLVAFVGSSNGAVAHARETTDELATLLRAARQTAIAKQTSVEIRVVPNDGGNWVHEAASSLPATGTALVFPLVKPINVDLRNWPGRVVFGPTGVADRGLDLYVGSPGHEYRLRMYQASGIIRIEHP